MEKKLKPDEGNKKKPLRIFRFLNLYCLCASVARFLMSRTVEIHIKRRENPDAPQHWEEFEIPYRPNLNVISCLMEIRKNPVTKHGKQTTPPSWDMNCLEQVCGICTMIINGRVRQSCSALVDNLEKPIKLEPMTKFPNIRDLIGGSLADVQSPQAGSCLG